jgi:hypothetical protein
MVLAAMAVAGGSLLFVPDCTGQAAVALGESLAGWPRCLVWVGTTFADPGIRAVVCNISDMKKDGRI